MRVCQRWYQLQYDYFWKQQIDLSWCVNRTSDAESLKWSVSLPYNGTIDILENHTEAVDGFLQGNTGWITFTCSSPFVSGYYVTNFGKGVIGADHLY